ncbi:hypothetical protein GCM10010432_10020 [Catellatospora methionotrophica]
MSTSADSRITGLGVTDASGWTAGVQPPIASVSKTAARRAGEAVIGRQLQTVERRGAPGAGRAPVVHYEGSAQPAIGVP